MAAGAEHLKERVSEYCLAKRAKVSKGDAFTGTLSGNWNEERFDSRLVTTDGKRAALPTELDHTWQSTYVAMNKDRQQQEHGKKGASPLAAAGKGGQLSNTTARLLDTLSGANSAANRLSQQRLTEIVDGRGRAFPGHQPEQDLPDKDGKLPSELPATTVVRESFIAPEEHRRRQQVNAADLYYGPAHDKARFTIFKLVQALQHRGVSARQSAAQAQTQRAQMVRTNYSFPGLRRALLDAERRPPVPGIDKRDGRLTLRELGEGLSAYGVGLEEPELLCFFKFLDRDGSGEVGAVEAVAAIRGQMNDRRRGIVARAFQLIESTMAHRNHIPHGQPVGVSLGDVLDYFDAESHPDVLSKAHDATFVRRQLFEEYYNIPDARLQEAARKAVVTADMFAEFYQDWSALVDADHYFERSVRDCWHISGGTGLAMNSSCKRVQVVHTNGRITQEEILNDLGVASDDDAAMRANLAAQGINDVKRITLLPRPEARQHA